MAIQSGGDVFDREQAEALLYPAKGLPVAVNWKYGWKYPRIILIPIYAASRVG